MRRRCRTASLRRRLGRRSRKLISRSARATTGRARSSTRWRIKLSRVTAKGRAPLRGRPFPILELAEHVLGAADLEVAGRLDVEFLDDTVVDDHRVALGALAHAEATAVHGQPERF